MGLSALILRSHVCCVGAPPGSVPNPSVEFDDGIVVYCGATDLTGLGDKKKEAEAKQVCMVSVALYCSVLALP